MKEWKPNPDMTRVSSSVVLKETVYVYGGEKAKEILLEQRENVSCIEIAMGCRGLMR